MPSSTRLYALLARDADRGVVLRRGPSKQVALIAWDVARDRFEVGQWLKGRIYERRCDLSPAGDKLIYFAASWKRPFHSWTAVSRPPYLTALLLWPKGDAWGGGGLFETPTRIALNHREGQTALADDFRKPPSVTVRRPPWGGAGEDGPIVDTRMRRDGWRQLDRGRTHERSYGASVWIDLDPPCVYERESGSGRTLRMSLRGIKERQGAWYVIDHDVRDADGGALALPRTDWADFARNGDLLFARGGKLFRLPGRAPLREESAREIADFSDLRFTPLEAPPRARRW